MRWLLGILLILLAALILESGLLAYSMYVLLGLLFISRIMARNWIGNLKATRTCRLIGRDGEELPGGGLIAEVGDKVAVRLTIRNEGATPVPWVLMEDLLPRQALDIRFPKLKVKGKRLQIAMLRGHGEKEIKYTIEFASRGYFQIGPLTLESGDLFGLHRRFRVEADPNFVLVYPKVVGLTGYDLTSRRPIGDVRMTHRLYEDPTRIAGVRVYEAGDPLNRVHWRATARTGALHSKIYEPSTLAGATLFLDFNQSGYHRQGEPIRSELAVTAAVSLVNAVCEMGQQVGLVTNGRDAADRIRLEGWEHDPRTRRAAQRAGAMAEKSERLQPQVVPTRRGVEQLQRIRETLARVELTDGLTFAALVTETVSRIPRDATVVAVMPQVPLESAIALGNLRRTGFAVTVVLVQMDRDSLELGYGRLIAENIRDIRHLCNEDMLPDLCRQHVDRSAPYALASID
jgi:uncharacterized protein (DUF58 family)